MQYCISILTLPVFPLIITDRLVILLMSLPEVRKSTLDSCRLLHFKDVCKQVVNKTVLTICPLWFHEENWNLSPGPVLASCLLLVPFKICGYQFQQEAAVYLYLLRKFANRGLKALLCWRVCGSIKVLQWMSERHAERGIFNRCKSSAKNVFLSRSHGVNQSRLEIVSDWRVKCEPVCFKVSTGLCRLFFRCWWLRSALACWFNPSAPALKPERGPCLGSGGCLCDKRPRPVPRVLGRNPLHT